MKRIVLFDPSACTLNLGDRIIFDGVESALKSLFGSSCFYVHVATHLAASQQYMAQLREADLRFVCGTNLLQARMIGRFRQWDVTLLRAPAIRPAILVGVGWWQYQQWVDPYTRYLWRGLLSDRFLHSVRDSYTLKKLVRIGIPNVINTGCPTLWKLTQEHCDKIPSKQGRVAVVTVTDYKRDYELDRALLNMVLEHYEQVFFWPQGFNDYQYFRELYEGNRITVIDPDLDHYDELLSSDWKWTMSARDYTVAFGPCSSDEEP